MRKIKRILVARPHPWLEEFKIVPEKVGKEQIDRLFAPHTIHQGIALEADPLQDGNIFELENCDKATVIILDQITDPQNIGAILRAAAVFNARAVLTTTKNAQTATTAKAASGAMELVPIIPIGNVAQSIKLLQKFGFWTIGLLEDGDTDLQAVQLPDKIALLIGAEGKGLRRLSIEHCDYKVRLESNPKFSTLNAAMAANIALYHIFTERSL